MLTGISKELKGINDDVKEVLNEIELSKKDDGYTEEQKNKNADFLEALFEKLSAVETALKDLLSSSTDKK